MALFTLRFLFITLLSLVSINSNAQPPTAETIVKAAIDNWRGVSSYSEMTMSIVRPDWQRTMSMQSWTEGDKKSLIRVTAPKKDRGNGTLLNEDAMWSFSPKINRVIKIPSSMMKQGWMGSDFSNKDIAKSDEIIDQYEHTLLSTESLDEHRVYVIQSIPHEDAAVVWGKEILKIRDDYVLLDHQFFDQDGVLVKTLVTLNIDIFDKRPVAQRQRMSKVNKPGEWTEISIQAAKFNVEIAGSLFTLSNLRNPRQ